MIADLNAWTDNERTRVLLSKLQGKAQMILARLKRAFIYRIRVYIVYLNYRKLRVNWSLKSPFRTFPAYTQKQIDPPVLSVICDCAAKCVSGFLCACVYGIYPKCSDTFNSLPHFSWNLNIEWWVEDSVDPNQSTRSTVRLYTVELQWLEPRWLVYHGWVEHVLESAGISSKYDI